MRRKFRRRHTRAKEIIAWILIIILASMVLGFIINPDAFDSLRGNLKSSLSKVLNNDNQYIKLSSYQFCIEGTFNKVICKSICNMEGLYYSFFRCEQGEAICYCKKE